MLGLIKAKMKLYQLSGLLEEDTCSYQTQQLEFWQAKEILEMHMRLVHPVTNHREDKSDTCDRDTNTSSDDLENDEKALCSDATEDLTAENETPENDIDNVNNDDKDDTDHKSSTSEQIKSGKVDIAEVTSVADDRDHDFELFEEALEAENNVVKEIFKPVGLLFSSCRSCGESDHTSERKIRRRSCPAWNIYCGTCGKRGHYRSVCKSTQGQSPLEEINFHFGETFNSGVCDGMKGTCFRQSLVKRPCALLGSNWFVF